MPIVFFPPASIECIEAFVTARKIIPSLPVRNSYKEIKVALLFPYKLDRNCEAIVKRELEPKKALVDPRSMLSAGDGIRGCMISGVCTKVVKQDKATVRKASGRHQASLIVLGDFVFAKLEKPFKALENKINLLLAR